MERDEHKKSLLTAITLLFLANGLVAKNRTFPYELKNRDYLIFSLRIGTAALGGSLKEDYRSITMEELMRLDRKDVMGFDRRATYNWSPHWSDLSDTFQDFVVIPCLFMVSIPPIFHAKLTETVTVATMLMESYLFLYGFTYLSKAAVGWKRPFVYNAALSVEERKAMARDDVFFSFFSGHAAGAFCAATFLSKVMSDIHGNSVWTYLLWGSNLSFAALTAYARVKAGKHYPTDVIAGAAVGFAIGYVVPMLHKKDRGNHVEIAISSNRISLCLKF